MLKLKYLYENFDLARFCLQNYDYDEASLEEYLNYFRISSNAIYPFKSLRLHKTCFLRLSPVEEKDIDEVKSEIQWINYLLEYHYPAMKPYPMKDGSLFKVIKTRWGNYNMSCFEGVSGKNLEDYDATMDIVYLYGQTLAKLHLLSVNYPYYNQRKDHNDLLEQIKQRLDQYCTKQEVFNYFNNVKEKLHMLPLDPAIYGMIHYDFEPDNVIYDPNTKQLNVIDFDDAINGWYTIDIVRVIDAINDVVGDEKVNEGIDTFLKGYRSIKEFTQEQENTLELMRSFVMLESYSTILHVLSEPVEDDIDWMIEIIENLNHTKESLEKRMK